VLRLLLALLGLLRLLLLAGLLILLLLRALLLPLLLLALLPVLLLLLLLLALLLPLLLLLLSRLIALLLLFLLLLLLLVLLVLRILRVHQPARPDQGQRADRGREDHPVKDSKSHEDLRPEIRFCQEPGTARSAPAAAAFAQVQSTRWRKNLLTDQRLGRLLDGHGSLGAAALSSNQEGHAPSKPSNSRRW
jgi:hypothetical protein